MKKVSRAWRRREVTGHFAIKGALSPLWGVGGKGAGKKAQGTEETAPVEGGTEPR